MLGEFGQVSKKLRNWTIKVENKGGASIVFDGSAGKSPNELLKGSWTFLNYGKVNEQEMMEEGSFDLAIPAESSATAYGEPSLTSNLVRILHCGEGKNVGTGDRVSGKTSSNSRALYCKDVSGSWYFGVIWGKYYGVTFAVKPDSILNKAILQETLSKESSQKLEEKGLLNEELVNILKLAAGPEKDFLEKAKTQNSTRYKDCKNLAVKGEGRDQLCFLWGTKFSKQSGENETENNCDSKDAEVNGCNIGIIDVSRYTGQAF